MADNANNLVTLHSSKFPGITMVLPERPSPPGGRGSYELHMGVEYELTAQSTQSIRDALRGYPRHVKSHIRLEVKPIEGVSPAATLPAAAIANPVVAGEETEPEPDDSGTAELAELTGDDKELIEVEVEKLYDKTIAEGKPLIESTAGNEKLPKLLRISYLEAVKADDQLQKGLKDTADEWLELLNSNGH